ncbi:MAG: tRNA (5-methylaminomethyl-2-thiouridine)(34)-methyltransferase MnmD [Bacteroidia bacterium]|nr:tRNA (5-methylaminomethyl-2-thiouridine)(34)-methyltransferase MnmD [Bacteroidia bacterium]
MKRRILTTKDGSHTIQIEEWEEQYHSVHGAIGESKHVFIENGLKHWLRVNSSNTIAILEYGFGTGLNTFLTYIETEQNCIKIDYVGLEAFPCKPEEIELLNYHELLKLEQSEFLNLHSSPWDRPVSISQNFVMTKKKISFDQFVSEKKYDLVYYDAFGSRVQPELWTRENFERIFDLLENNGVLVTYSSKGRVRRAMEDIGYRVERLPGPPGKRHMLRATKIT